jgi:hypothetical protein
MESSSDSSEVSLVFNKLYMNCQCLVLTNANLHFQDEVVLSDHEGQSGSEEEVHNQDDDDGDEDDPQPRDKEEPQPRNGDDPQPQDDYDQPGASVERSVASVGKSISSV